MSSSSPSSASPGSELVHLRTVYDERVHEYQLQARSLLFAQLQQLTTAKYPLTPLYFHFVDEDGDRCRITCEAELREAIRVCGAHLTVLLSSSLPLPSSPSAPEVASPTHLSSHSSSASSPSPLPMLSSPSPHPQPPSSASSAHPYPSSDDYLSSDEEDVWEQARSQVRQGGQLGGEEEEHSGQEYGVVVLDSEDEEAVEVEVEVEVEEEKAEPSSALSITVEPPASASSDVGLQPPQPSPPPQPSSPASATSVAAEAEPAVAKEETKEALVEVLSAAEKEADAPSLSDAKEVAEVKSADASTLSPDVLVVESVRISAKIVERALTHAHFTVHIVADGEMAIDAYLQYAASLRVVLMEVRLPGMSGLEVAEHIRQAEQARGDGRRVRIFAHTQMVTDSNLRQYHRAGMDGCISKAQLNIADALQRVMNVSERAQGSFVGLTGASTLSTPSIVFPASSAPALPTTPPDQQLVASVIKSRLEAFYGAEMAEPSSPLVRAEDDTALGVLFASFFSDPDVLSTLTAHSARLSPLMSSRSLALFLHEVSVLNPRVAAHPLLAYAFRVGGVHAGSTCAVCTVSPIIGVRYSCTDCAASLCEECKAMGTHNPAHVLLPLHVPAPLPLARPVEEEKKEGLDGGGSGPRQHLSMRVLEGGKRVWSTVEERLERLDMALTKYAAELKRMVEEMMDGVFPSPPPLAQRPPLSSPPAPPARCEVRPDCLPFRPFQHPPPAGMCARSDVAAAATVVAAPAEVVVEPPVRERMGEGVRGEWMSEVEQIREMGLIHGEVEEATVRELLKGSRGNVAQTVQWLLGPLALAV